MKKRYMDPQLKVVEVKPQLMQMSLDPDAPTYSNDSADLGFEYAEDEEYEDGDY